MSTPRKPRIGLALGSGSARGWAHVGVIRGLAEAGIKPDLICGTSIGAMVGAAYAAGELDRFEKWLLGLRMMDIVAMLDVSLTGGFIKGERVMQFFRGQFVDRPIAELAVPFAAVATALHTGAEVWLRDGSTVEAVRASLALPGLFTPVLRDDLTLVDGGLVNPVPVSLARAMGADLVIAVDLGSDILGRHLRLAPVVESSPSLTGEFMKKLQDQFGSWLPSRTASLGPKLPSMLDVLASSLNIMQVRITRSRMAGEPPDAVVAPRLAHLGLMDFHRASEAIEEGRRAVAAIVPGLRLLGL